ncbi:MAG: C25 family cysteine peptidase [Candidatus Jordarchaeum sp.]|uniref:C25 family cysteine peptidase n=1 Tax=Candidatus Jordarchaeum sp. TaxID=2823881 RepID=UPI00404B2493
MRISLVKLGLLIFLLTMAVSLLLLPTPNSWVPMVISHNQQATRIQNVPTPVILTTNTTQYIIIAPDNWTNNTNLIQFAEWKTQKGIPTAIFNTTYIYENYPGKDESEQIRNFLIYAYNQWNISWLLLAGDTNEIPIRNFWTGFEYVPSDYYYAALDGCFDNNGNGRYGEFGEIDWIPELYVGRLPASNETELEYMINKTLTYERDIEAWVGDWMRTAVFAGGEIDQDLDIQGWRIKHYIGENVIPPKLNMNFIYLFWGSNITYNNLTRGNFVNAINEGCAIVNFCSHGSYSTVTVSKSGVSYFSTSDAYGLSNEYELPLVFASACSTLRLDDRDCIGEAMLKNPNGGAISYIGATRTSFGGDTIDDLSDSLLDALFFQILLHTDDGLFSQRPGYALYESKHQYFQEVGLLRMATSYVYRQEFLVYILLGDPELPIWTNTPQNLSIILPESTPIPGQIMQIKVKSGEGAPVGGALVCINGTNYYHTYLTESDGSIRIPAPQTGNYSITVSKPNFLHNNTVLEVGASIDQPSTFVLEAPTKISPGEQFTIQVYASDPQGIAWLEVVVTDYHKVMVNSTFFPPGNFNVVISMVINSSFFNNRSVVFYASAIDSEGYQTFSDAQKVYVQSPLVTPLVLPVIINFSDESFSRILWLSSPFLICVMVAVFAWPSKEE